MKLDLFPGHRLLAREYLTVLFADSGFKVQIRTAYCNVGPSADVAFVSDFGEWSIDSQRKLLERYERIFVLWWNDEEELLRSACKNPAIPKHPSVTHLFFFGEACQAARASGFISFCLKPFFAATQRFTAVSPLLSGVLRRYLVAMEVTLSPRSVDNSGLTSRFEQANSDRRKFLTLISSRREDFLLVGPEMRSFDGFSLPRIPQRNPGFLQVMPFIMYLTCGVIELGSKSGSTSMTPRLTDSLAVGTPVHALSFGPESLVMPGVKWYPSVESLAMLPRPRPIKRPERASIRSSFRRLQSNEKERFLHLMREGNGDLR